VGAGLALLPSRLPQPGSPLGATAANPLPGPVAIAPGNVFVPALVLGLRDQLGSLLQGSSGNDVLIGGAVSDLIFGGLACDVLVGGFDHSQAKLTGYGEVALACRADLDVNAEAVRQVAGGQSATGSLAGLDDRAGVAGSAWLGEQADVDMWASVSNNPDGFLPDAPG
jgi:Ca2+-binding RTX toxin-like protein